MGYFGYGIDTSKEDFKYNPDTITLLWEKAKTVSWFQSDYAEFCADWNLPPDDVETFLKYMDEYEDASLGTYNAGTEGFIANMLNALSGAAGNPFRYRDYCIFVEATIPADETEKKAMLTTERIRKIMAEYLAPLVEGLYFEWLLIND